MQNKILAQLCTGSSGSIGQFYLDTAAELSVIQRLNNHQVNAKGEALMYDILITATPNMPYKVDGGTGTLEQQQLEIQTETCPNSWQTRNAVKAIHRSREDLRKASGISKHSIGKYAKTLRLNMDDTMRAIGYVRSASDCADAIQRIYAHDDMIPAVPTVFTGGVWDYTQLTSVVYDQPTGPETQADAFSVNVCGGHNGTVPGPYVSIGALLAYNQRRQTVFDSATATAGGDTQFVVDDSPLFRIVDKDIGEDLYTDITYGEQDNPPYDRSTLATSDSMIPTVVDMARFANQNGLTSQSWRVQAPLGLVKLQMRTDAANVEVDFEFEVMATYPME